MEFIKQHWIKILIAATAILAVWYFMRRKAANEQAEAEAAQRTIENALGGNVAEAQMIADKIDNCMYRFAQKQGATPGSREYLQFAEECGALQTALGEKWYTLNGMKRVPKK